jgi:hypothetical protein
MILLSIYSLFIIHSQLKFILLFSEGRISINSELIDSDEVAKLLNIEVKHL